MIRKAFILFMLSLPVYSIAQTSLVTPVSARNQCPDAECTQNPEDKPPGRSSAPSPITAQADACTAP